jgi:hypothetical protein
MWSKVVRKGVEWRYMSVKTHNSKRTVDALFLPNHLTLTGDCPK